MTVATYALEVKLVGPATGLEVDLLSLQGLWTVPQYLKITDSTRYLIEFTTGALEILPMPTEQHQTILEFFYRAFFVWLAQVGGRVHVAALRLQISADKFREPDLLLLLDARDPRRQNRFWRGADLVLEVVSPDDPERDTVVKRDDYAAAGIPEYWIVNPLDETITVLTLRDAAYVAHGVFRRGAPATSVLLAGFALDVAAVFDAD
ncbi:MAG TPA: Uma2 family endonuclease [Chloroflexia bacterium]|nr:Uma2 family endonuclease [Chloroflexia bacterium]